jgi:ER-bound oxygenase mpaB/B'/Rubber oxygenase, catalytic domain
MATSWRRPIMGTDTYTNSGAVPGNSLVLPALTQGQRELYYAESQLLAALFGIPKACLSRDSRDWAAFTSYTEAMAQSGPGPEVDRCRFDHLVGAHLVLRRAPALESGSNQAGDTSGLPFSTT